MSRYNIKSWVDSGGKILPKHWPGFLRWSTRRLKMDRAEIGAIVITIFFPLLSVTFINCTIEFFKKWAIPGLFFFILYFLLTVNRKYWFDKRWRWLDSNRGTLGSDYSANRATTTAQFKKDLLPCQIASPFDKKLGRFVNFSLYLVKRPTFLLNGQVIGQVNTTF